MKSYKYIATMALAFLMMQANAQSNVTMSVSTNNVQDMQVYSKQKTGKFRVYTKYFFSQFWGFWNQSLIASNEFQNSTQDGCVLPKGAKVTHIYLKGFNNGGKTTTLHAKTYIENVENDYVLDKTHGYNSIQLPDAQYVYSAGNNGIVTTTFSQNSTESNPDYVENIPLYRPFIYDGKAVLISLDQWYDGAAMNFYFETTTAIDPQTITVFRSGKRAKSDAVVPAFTLDYYTNDLCGTVLAENGQPVAGERPTVKLYDMTTQKHLVCDGQTTLNNEQACEVNADGTFKFTNLDHAHTYQLTVGNATCGYTQKIITFDGEAEAGATLSENAIKNDIAVNVVMTTSK